MKKKTNNNGYTIFGRVLLVFAIIILFYLKVEGYDNMTVLATIISIVLLAFVFFGIGKNRRMIEELFHKLDLKSDEENTPPSEDLDYKWYTDKIE